MSKVIAAITTSVDGYIVGPQDGPEHGLGVGGERLHYWVMGGPWTYADDDPDTDGMHGADREYYEAITDGLGGGIVGRNMYDAAGAWGGTNPFPGTLIVLTHRTEEQPDPSTTSTSRCSARGVRSTPPTCVTPSRALRRTTPRTDTDRPICPYLPTLGRPL